MNVVFHTAINVSLDKWSPALQIRTVLLSIQALLSAPNPDDPLANDVAEQWKTNEAQAIETGDVSDAFLLALGNTMSRWLIARGIEIPTFSFVPATCRSNYCMQLLSGFPAVVYSSA